MRPKVQLLLGTALVAALIAGGTFGGVLSESPPAGTQASPAVVAGLADSALGGLTGRDTVTHIRRLEAAVSSGGNADVLARLGFAYQLRWRETADASFLPRSEAALRKALTERPNDPAATLGLGSLALIQHDFRKALLLGRKARRLAPDSAQPYAVVGDALLELGRYDEAFAAFEKMVATRPTLAGYARIAYARELRGDRAGAIDAMKLALDTAGGVPEPTAWTLVELAKLELGRGRLTSAEQALRQAQRVFPGYVYAGEQQARVLFARGRTGAAVRQARRVSEAIPLPQFVALLADLLERRGDRAEAMRQRATVGAIQRLLAASGVRTDLDDAFYRADLALAPAATVELARRARADRPSVHGDDALGWALARAGRCREATRWLDRALRLGTKDATLFFHRGYAAGCAGDAAGRTEWYRKAVALNPHFSVRWAPVARRALGASNR